MIYLSCEHMTPIGRREVYDYVRSLEISVYGFSPEPILLGKYQVEHILVSQAEDDGENLFDIFDARSGDLHYVYSAFYGPDDEFQPELNVEELTFHLICLWDSVIHPKLQPYEQGILETIGTLFGNETILVVHRDATTLPDKKLAESGFAKISNTQLIYRHLAYSSQFTKDNPKGIDVPLDLEANSEDEEWVKTRWARIEPNG